jgi:uncharacterized membrane protein YdjX (TVP38/TMEM64 family)
MTPSDIPPHARLRRCRRWSPWRLLPFIVVVAGLAAFYLFGGQRFLSFEAVYEHRQALLAWRDDNYALTSLVFVAIYVLAVSFSVPGAVWLTITGGFLFGPFVSVVYVVFAATLGACLVFLMTRYAFADVMRAKAGPALAKMEAGFRRNALSYLLVLRLVPLFPFWLVNLAPALIGVPLRTYLVGTFFGIIPGSLVYCLVGNGLGALFEAGERPDVDIIMRPQILLPMLGLALLSLVPIFYRRRRTLGADR